MKRAKCAGKAPNKRKNPEAKDPWFPAKGESPNPGRADCFTCDVRAECNDYKVRTDSRHGMWAGQIQKRDNGK